MPLCKWHTFWMAPCLICYFIVILFYIERKWLLMRNLAITLPLKSKFSGKFQHFITIVESIEILKNIWKIAKHFTRPNQQENYSASPHRTYHQIKFCYVFVANIFSGRFTEIYRHLLSKCFKKVVLGRQEMVQCKCFFLHQTETCLLEICKLRKFYGCVLGAFYFQFQKSWDS